MILTKLTAINKTSNGYLDYILANCVKPKE